MKLSYRYILMAAPLLFAACDKKLDDLKPHNVLLEEQEYATPAGFTKVTIGCYNRISQSTYDANWFNLSEYRGNNVKLIDATSTQVNADAQNTDAYNYLNSSSKDFGKSDEFWKASYNALLNINILLSHVKPDETNAEILQAKAENLFLRAVIYFNLVRLYGRPYYQSPQSNLGVPLILTRLGAQSTPPARATVAETYDQIIADLFESVKLFREKKVNSYANKYAAFALLSRVYLYKSGTYEQPDRDNAELAVQYADSVITNGGYNLLQGAAYSAYYNASNQSNTETIWAVNHNALTSSYPSLLNQPTGVYSGSTQYSTGQMKPSPDLLALFATGDLRRGFFKTDKYRNNDIDTLSTTKYLFNYTAVYTSDAPNHYLRLAEIFLNRAEAKAKLGENAGALADVNVIRTRSQVGEISGLTGKPLFDEILKQRRLELCFEGHNSYDYFRNGLSMVRSYTAFSAAPLTVIATDPKVVMRISDDILIENGNVKQNIQ